MNRQQSELGTPWWQVTMDLIAAIPVTVSEWWEESGFQGWFEGLVGDNAKQRRSALRESLMDDPVDEDISFQNSGFPRSALGKTPKERVEMLKWAIEQDKILVADEVALLMQQKKDKLDAPTTVQISNIKRDVAALRELLRMIKLDQGWTPAGRDAKGIRVMYRKEPDSPFIMTKTSTILEPSKGEDVVSLFIKYVSLFKETDLMPLWFPRKLLASNDTLKEITPFQLVTNLKLNTPIYIPIGKRECYLLGRGYDMAERKAICISFKSIEGDLGYYRVPSVEQTGIPRFEIRGAYYVEMKPGRGGRGGHIVFHALQLLDLKMKFVPTSVINLISKGALPFEFINSIKKAIANHSGSPWEQRVIQREEFYSNLRSRLRAVVAEAAVATEASLTSTEENSSDETQVEKKKSSLIRQVVSRFSMVRKSRSESGPPAGELQLSPSITQRLRSKVSSIRRRSSRPIPPPVPHAG